MSPQLAPVLIDEELASFLQQGNSILVATRNSALAPHAVRACGIRVLASARVAVLLPRATAEPSVENLRQNGSVAVCVSSPRDFRSIQLKGRLIAIGDASPEDLLACEEQLYGFSDAVVPYGTTRMAARNLWLFDNWCAELEVTALYTQTPGPGAGEPVHGG